MTAVAVASAPGLVVFSEVYEEGWNAYVDGERVDILRTDHALRGVPVLAGKHTIEFRYDPESIRIGLWISGVSGLGVLLIFALAAGRWVREYSAGRVLVPSRAAPSHGASPGVRSPRRPPWGAPGVSISSAESAHLQHDR